MKIYDVVSHRTFDIDPESVNVNATKNALGHTVYLHECADKYKLPYACGNLCVSKKVWKKITTVPRKKW